MKFSGIGLAFVYLLLLLVQAIAQLPALPNETIHSHIALSFNMFENELLHLSFNCSFKAINESSELQDISPINVISEDVTIAGFKSDNHSKPTIQSSYCCINGTLNVLLVGGHLGVTDIVLDSLSADIVSDELVSKRAVIQVKVLRKPTLLDKLTVFLLGPLVLINKCAFGAKIEIDVLKRVLTKPLELVLCLLVQFVVMPLVAVLYGFLFQLSQVMALALFVAASCPGGGGGYVFSFLINGDITLAITASLMSTLVAMGAMPAVIGLYTHVAKLPSEIRIPYLDILLMLFAIAIPISSGMFIRKKWPEFASKLIKVIKPLSFLVIAGGLIIVVFTSRYVLYGPKIGMLLAFLLPLSIFLIALLLSLCLSLSWPLSKAVSLESGLKNTVLGIAVIELSFPQPEADLASILIIMITIGHTLTALAWYFLYLIKSKCEQKPTKVGYIKAEEDVEETALFLEAEDK